MEQGSFSKTVFYWESLAIDELVLQTVPSLYPAEKFEREVHYSSRHSRLLLPFARQISAELRR